MLEFPAPAEGSSWWVGLDRAAFYARLYLVELPRMRAERPPGTVDQYLSGVFTRWALEMLDGREQWARAA